MTVTAKAAAVTEVVKGQLKGSREEKNVSAQLMKIFQGCKC